MSEINPQNNPYLVGHEDAENSFLKSWKAGKLHNSWLITGPEGIGKATFAYKLARFLLAAGENQKIACNSLDIAENNPVFRLVSNNSHPDLKIIQRDFIETDKKKVIKAIKDGDAMDAKQLQELKKSAVIKVDEVRAVNEFLSKKSFDGNWRIVIVDSVDDLNTAGANAILKILEEPPVKSLLLLISHNPGSLLPTIRSRCAKINLQPLNENIVASLLRRYRPQLNETEIKGLAKISSGSIGRAINYADNDGLGLYEKLEKIFYSRSKLEVSDVLELCESAAHDESVWCLLSELIVKFMSEMFKSGENIKEMGNAWDFSMRLFRETESLNMDKKQVLLNIITTIYKAV